MSRSHLVNNEHQEKQRFLKRSVVCIGGVFFLFVILCARLVYLQIIEHHFYQTLSNKNIISVIPISPIRGLIYDRNGVLLAKNMPVYRLMIIPGRVKDLDATLLALKPIVGLTDDDITQFKHKKTQFHRYQMVPLKDHLTETEVDQFYVNHYRFPGVIVQRSFMRDYPLNSTLSDVVGYVGKINTQELASVPADNYTPSDDIGKAGIEAQDETLLHGKAGSEEAEINAAGKIVRVIKVTPPVPGDNITLTIDSRLQSYAQKTLKNESGAIVAIQPNTGQVLALVTNPSFNPNLFVKGISSKTYQQLLSDPEHPLFNRALKGLYAPGSTVKPFIAAAALNDGVISPDFKILDHGFYQVPNTKHIFHDWKRNGHGWVNVYKAIIVSCDTFFYTLADKLGVKSLDNALDLFGFGQKTGIDLPGERSGVVPTPHWKRAYRGQSWYTGDTVLTGIGQGFMLSTPLQLAYATAIMAEHGTGYIPTLLLKLKTPGGKVDQIQPEQTKHIAFQKPGIWQLVISGMRGVIMNHLGTAWAFGKNASYTAAAKTGTAQVYGHNRDEERSRTNIPYKLRNNHLFIVFAPIKHPQIALAVVVEHASFADRIARNILDFYFKHCADDGDIKNALHASK